MVSDQAPPPTYCNYAQPNISPLKIANAAAAPSDKKSTGHRTPVQLACLSQYALSYEHLFITVRNALWVPVPPSTKLTPHQTYTMSPASHTFLFQATQTVKPASCQERSKLPLPKAQRNCPVIVHSSTAHEGGGHRWKVGGLAAFVVNCVKFQTVTVSSVSRGVWLQILDVRFKLYNT